VRLVPVLMVVIASAAWAAEDARVAFLVKQLSTARDPRVRSQTALLLGQTGAEAAVAPLCGLLADVEVVVRGAAVNALGELRLAEGQVCLRDAAAETDPGVRAELQKALAKVPVGAGALYVAVEPVQDKLGTLGEPLVQLAEAVLRDKLAGRFHAALAPANEERRAAVALVKARQLRAFQLRLQLLPGSTERALTVEMLVMTYPEQSLRGTWNVKAAGGKPESLIKAMVPRVLDDAAADLEWKP
jgi:HEAT repeats